MLGSVPSFVCGSRDLFLEEWATHDHIKINSASDLFSTGEPTLLTISDRLPRILSLLGWRCQSVGTLSNLTFTVHSWHVEKSGMRSNKQAACILNSFTLCNLYLFADLSKVFVLNPTEVHQIRYWNRNTKVTRITVGLACSLCCLFMGAYRNSAGKVSTK